MDVLAASCKSQSIGLGSLLPWALLDCGLFDRRPSEAALRHGESGMDKRAKWEETWALQRRQDTGEDVGEVPVPPK